MKDTLGESFLSSWTKEGEDGVKSVKKKKKTKNLYLGFTYFKQGRICITGQHKKKGTLEDFFWNSRDRRLQEIKFPSPPEHGPQCRSRDLGM